MKRYILLLILSLLICQSFAQVFKERRRSSYIGARVGYNLSNWSGLVYDLPGVVVNNVPGYMGGIFVSTKLGDNFTLEPAVYFSMKGWEAEGTLNDGQNVLEGKITNNINYLDAPLMFRMFLKGLSFGAGPQVSLPLKNTLKFSGTYNGIPGTTKFDDVSGLNDFDVLLVLSLGYEFDFGLSFHATYDLGLTDTAALYPYPSQFPYWTESKTRTLKFTIGFMIY